MQVDTSTKGTPYCPGIIHSQVKKEMSYCTQLHKHSERERRKGREKGNERQRETGRATEKEGGGGRRKRGWGEEKRGKGSRRPQVPSLSPCAQPLLEGH